MLEWADCCKGYAARDGVKDASISVCLGISNPHPCYHHWVYFTTSYSVLQHCDRKVTTFYFAVTILESTSGWWFDAAAKVLEYLHPVLEYLGQIPANTSASDSASCWSTSRGSGWCLGSWLAAGSVGALNGFQVPSSGLQPGYCRHLGSKPVDERLLSVSLPFK